MHFGFVLELSDIVLWNIDLLDKHLDLLDTDILSKYFVCLHRVFKTSSRYVFKTSSRPVLKTSSRRLQDQQMFVGPLCSEKTYQKESITIISKDKEETINKIEEQAETNFFSVACLII